MYWYSPQLKNAVIIAGAVILAVCALACKPGIKETSKYFDLAGYFKKDAARLALLKKPVVKTVLHNGITETKTVPINDWPRELDLFSGADINKPAWKYSYTTISEGDLLFYKAKEKDLRVREVIIKEDAQQIKWILIYTKTENFLYKTTEKLSYFPDSLYMIEKTQKVKLLGANYYKIQGLIGR